MPNLDILKLAIIVIMVAVLALGFVWVASMQIGASEGKASFQQLDMPAEGVGGSTDWSPASVSTVLFPALFARLNGDGISFQPWLAIVGAFGVALAAVLGVLIIKLIRLVLK